MSVKEASCVKRRTIKRLLVTEKLPTENKTFHLTRTLTISRSIKGLRQFVTDLTP